MVVSLLTRDMIRVLEKGEEGVLWDSRISSCILTNSFSGFTTYLVLLVILLAHFLTTISL